MHTRPRQELEGPELGQEDSSSEASRSIMVHKTLSRNYPTQRRAGRIAQVIRVSNLTQIK
jgi:hypothetical protein